MRRIAVSLLTLAALFGAAKAATVTIDSGALTGSSSGNIDSYKGIPYAAPPVGALRWEPPAKPASWNGARDATEFGAICPQPPRPDLGGFIGGNLKQDEDCLSLNVWAPHDAKHAPVMVWIHGGAHRFGSSASPIYDGTAFARDGIVLVSINYRLGLLGYFAHPALTKAAKPGEPLGNYGQMDQIAALAWVKRNIAAFGGDPDNVTVFGESAGGESILWLLATPSAKGLFNKAIVESGGGWYQPSTLASKEKEGADFATAAGLPGANATLDQLRALPADKTFDAPSKLGFGPFVDGRLITETPTQAFAAGREIDIPLMIGSNSFEASLMKSFSIPTAGFISRLPPGARALYPDAKSDDEFAHAVFTDSVMGGPAHWIAGRASSGAPSYLYHFSYVPTLRRGRTEGAGHGSEIPFAFATVEDIAARFGVQPSAEDKATENLMHACWVNFARTGAPDCGDWKPYTPSSDTLMEFDVASGPRSGFHKLQYDALEQRVLPIYGISPH